MPKPVHITLTIKEVTHYEKNKNKTNTIRPPGEAHARHSVSDG